MKAVIPAAGLGTRFLPATKNSPKEMLPVVDKPAIQYVVEECVASGITDILIITGRGKRTLEDHFDRSFELELLLERKGDKKGLDEIRRIADMAEIHYVRQRETKGLGHAVACARHHIGDEPFALLLGDDIIVSKTPATKQLMDKHKRFGGGIVAVEHVKDVSAYGIVDPGAEVAPRLLQIKDLVEKPSPKDAPSDLGIMGRYILPPEIFSAIERTPAGKGGEIQLTDALRLLAKDKELYAYAMEGHRYDLGDKLGWLRANIDVALERPEFRAPLLEFLRQRSGGS